MYGKVATLQFPQLSRKGDSRGITKKKHSFLEEPSDFIKFSLVREDHVDAAKNNQSSCRFQHPEIFSVSTRKPTKGCGLNCSKGKKKRNKPPQTPQKKPRAPTPSYPSVTHPFISRHSDLKPGGFAKNAASAKSLSWHWPGQPMVRKGLREHLPESQSWGTTLQEINISHLGKRKIIFKMDFSGDMLVPRKVFFMAWFLNHHFFQVKVYHHPNRKHQILKWWVDFWNLSRWLKPQKGVTHVNQPPVFQVRTVGFREGYLFVPRFPEQGCCWQSQMRRMGMEYLHLWSVT